jgi:hypothetical protein
VVGHDHNRVDAPCAVDHLPGEAILSSAAVFIVADDGLAATSARHEVVDCIAKLESQMAWHRTIRLPRRRDACKKTGK